ncbi:MAG: pyridoxal phosphate-dependent aminotransferase [Lactobacillaceae bacterium]|jgi:aspartate aminotransferase|nr:pyridoxal phosphate-dependent aminotransferase [Lactobacillaceae bacterium]
MRDLQKTKGFMGDLAPSATLAISGKAKELKAQGLDVCSMSAGEPDFDTPQGIKDACIKALNEGKVGYTPASGIMELKQAVVKKFEKNNIKTTPANVIAAPGAKFSVFSTVCALCGPGDEVLIPAPYWLSYPEIVRASGAKSVEIKTLKENNFELTPKQLEDHITPNTRLLILNSPCNPTGTVYKKETLEKLADVLVKHNVMVISDEIYEELIYDNEYPHVSIGGLNDKIAELAITVNGFSKAYAMTGWRLGYLTAPLWLAKKIAALQSHATSNPTSFVQYAGLAALNGAADKEVGEMRKAFAQRRDLICELLSKIPDLEFIRPSGAFYVLCDISKFGMTSEEFCAKLLEQELVAAIPCGSFGAEGFIRLSYACSEENIRKSIERIKNFCASLR